MTDGRAGNTTRSLPFRRLTVGFWVRLIVLGIIDALALYAVPFLIRDGQWLLLLALVVGAAGLNWVYIRPRGYPLRWLAPGVVMMLLLVVWPVFYTAFIGVTNLADGHRLSKAEAIDRLETLETFVPEDPEEFTLYVFSSEAQPGEFRFLLERDDGELLFGTPRPQSAEAVDDGLADLSTFDVTDDDGDGIPETIDGFARLQLVDLLAVASQVQDLVLDLPQGEARPNTATSARLASTRYRYDAARDVLLDLKTGAECTVREAGFVCDGVEISPGWQEVIGLENFARVINNERIRAPFLRVFVWNLAFAAISVVGTLAVGLFFSLALQHERLRAKKLYRSLLILPYAMPAFISVFVWRGLFNRQFGAVNRTLEPILDLIGADPIPWLTNGVWAKVAVLLVNIWLGFPYMMLITTGALQAIPGELIEAARVDGATSGRAFRRVTFPLLMVSIAPLLIGSFAFNFNNFVTIFLLNSGGPPLVGFDVPVGETDILISFTYNIALGTARGADFGLASAITIFIFGIVVLLSAFSFRYTKRLEEVYGYA